MFDLNMEEKYKKEWKELCNKCNAKELENEWTFITFFYDFYRRIKDTDDLHFAIQHDRDFLSYINYTSPSGEERIWAGEKNHEYFNLQMILQENEFLLNQIIKKFNEYWENLKKKND